MCFGCTSPSLPKVALLHPTTKQTETRNTGTGHTLLSLLNGPINISRPLEHHTSSVDPRAAITRDPKITTDTARDSRFESSRERTRTTEGKRRTQRWQSCRACLTMRFCNEGFLRWVYIANVGNIHMGTLSLGGESAEMGTYGVGFEGVGRKCA